MIPGVTIRKRLMGLSIVLSLLFLAVIVRVGRLTLVDAESLTQRGLAQWTRTGRITADRGTILDQNGQTLALNATAYTITAAPRLVPDPAALLDLLCPLLGIEREASLEKLLRKDLAAVTLKRQVPRALVDALKEITRENPSLLKGITFDQDSLRFYPFGSMLSQVLGLTTIDGKGQAGLEWQYDTLLTGTPGRIVTEVDAKARTLPDGQTAYIPAEKGADVTLTINATFQAFLERGLRECLAVTGAKRVMAIMMEPNTGKILAMGIHPSFDPNEPPRNDLTALSDGMRIQLISDVYEPGSTFKILTAAAALDKGVTTAQEGFYCTGSIVVDGDRIRCWHTGHGTETMAQALNNSCNPVFTELALRLGVEDFYRYLYAFGLGTLTGIDLPGESAGLLIRPKYVKQVDLARIGFGQSVTVTPLQMITAGCAAINGGRLMKPYLVDQVIAVDGTIEREAIPEVQGTPIREETSLLLRTLLEDVVATGGGRNAAIQGYRIGGKTGTAQLYRDSKIVRDAHIGSFFGFAPADDPQVSILWIVDEATLMPDFGGTTAAPFARQVLEDTLSHMGVPNTQEKAKAVEVPDVRAMPVDQAQRALVAVRLTGMTNGSQPIVLAQMPAPGAMLAQGSQVMLYVSEEAPPDAQAYVLVPDVSGMSILEASRQLRTRNLALAVDGTGLAVSQNPHGGAFVPNGSTVTVTFEAIVQGGKP